MKNVCFFFAKFYVFFSNNSDKLLLYKLIISFQTKIYIGDFQVEEQVLDSLSWQHKSPLWELININEKKIPKYEDIALVTIVGSNTINQNQKLENNLALTKGNTNFYNIYHFPKII